MLLKHLFFISLIVGLYSCNQKLKNSNFLTSNSSTDPFVRGPAGKETGNEENLDPSINDSDNDGVNDIDDLCPRTPEDEEANEQGCSERQEGPSAQCSGEIGTICYGGYDGDPNKKEVPLKILLMGNFNINTESYAKNIVELANSKLNFNGHQMFKFSFDSVEVVADIGPGDLISDDNWNDGYMDSSYMQENYGELNKFVFILVRGMTNTTNGTLGYSPGLRTNWKKKESIVVLDFDNSSQIVTVHELFHGLGAPHTCDGNGSRGDNLLQPGHQLYKDLQYHSNLTGGRFISALKNRPSSSLVDFYTYLEDDIFFLGIRDVDVGNGKIIPYDTRTLMYQTALGFKELFTSEDNGYTAAYSSILDSYYKEFVE